MLIVFDHDLYESIDSSLLERQANTNALRLTLSVHDSSQCALCDCWRSEVQIQDHVLTSLCQACLTSIFVKCVKSAWNVKQTYDIDSPCIALGKKVLAETRFGLAQCYNTLSNLLAHLLSCTFVLTSAIHAHFGVGWFWKTTAVAYSSVSHGIKSTRIFYLK